MKSPIIFLVVIILGSLSFPTVMDSPTQLDLKFLSSLDQDASFRRISAWVEKEYVYSHCQYLWEQDSRIIRVRQGIGVVPLGNGEGYRKFSYNMDIRISGHQVELSFSNLKAMADYRERVAFSGLNPRDGQDFLWMKESLNQLGAGLEELLRQ